MKKKLCRLAGDNEESPFFSQNSKVDEAQNFRDPLRVRTFST